MAYINNNKIKGFGGIKRAYLNCTLIFQSFKKDEEVISPYDITAKFNVTSTTEPTQLYYGERNYFTELYVDGEQIDVSSGYTFNTLGEHTVQYVLLSKTRIDTDAFEGCSNIISVVIDCNVKEIGDYSFWNCNNLSSITLPSSVETIGYSAFESCSKLMSIIIPENVTYIGISAFRYCSSLKSITCYGTFHPSLGGNAFEGLPDRGTLYIPQGSDYSTWISELSTWNVEYLT